MSGPVAELPFVDEHAIVVDAPALAVWRAVGASLPRGPLVDLFAGRLLGASPSGAHGDPLLEGSSIPGFRVNEAIPGRRLVLAGRHRFSDYALVFELDEHDRATRLTARSLARFPGVRGTAYRALVIRSRGHRVLVRRWLGRIRDAAERTENHATREDP